MVATTPAHPGAPSVTASMTTEDILAGLDYQTAAWAELSREYYRRRNGEAGKRADEYAALCQAAAQLCQAAAQRLRELDILDQKAAKPA